MKIVAISDVHGKWNKLVIPECDLLVSAGDYSFRGEPHMVRDFHKWMSEQPAKYKISVQGNHEKQVESNFLLSKQMAEEACPGIIFVDEGLVTVEGFLIWCSAITPFFYNWAWNRYPGEEIQKHWDLIPNNVDIVVTHGPVYGILDSVPEFNMKLGEMNLKHCGCPQLLKRILEIKPKAHFFGHIHFSHGIEINNGIQFINASICDEQYNPTNKPILVNL